MANSDISGVAVELSMEDMWSTVSSKGEMQIAAHRLKMQEVRGRIDELEKVECSERDENELVKLSETRSSLEGKLEELEKQKQEFLKFMDELLVKVSKSQSKPEIKRYEKEFELELRRFESALPMYARKTDIVQTIGGNQVSIILGETGSGKSTQILQYLHNAGIDANGIIVCTQPRKVAATSLARRVSQEMGCDVGQLVGYQVGMQSRRSRATKLLYVTDHMLLNDCLKDSQFTKYSCIVIDEAHERTIFTDILLGFIKRALPDRSDLHIVIMSATINPYIFQSYFAKDGDSKPPVLQVSGRAFPVDVFYETASDDYVKAAVQKASQVHKTEPPGDVLVFLTSQIETERARKGIMSQSGGSSDITAMELHGKLQPDDQQKVFNATPVGSRKIVFATNTAETSITIPGIKYVIDSGKVNEASYDPSKNMSTLAVQWVTKSSAEQRKGRAGRTDCGKCFRLYSKEEFDQWRPDSVPEILRVHLGQAFLKLMALGIKDPQKFDFVESPSRDAISSALAVLRQLGAYDDNGLTDVGRKLVKLPIDPTLGKVILRGIEEDIHLEGVLMATVMAVGGNMFYRAGTEEEKQQADRKKTRFCDE